MSKVEDRELEKVLGGTSLSGTIINAITNFTKLLYEVGHDFGSAIRRIGTGNMCPMK